MPGKRWIRFLLIIFFFLLLCSFAAGCRDSGEIGDHYLSYGQDDLHSYVIDEVSSTELIHWFNTHHLEPGIAYLFSEGDLYLMATYERLDLMDMEIDEVVFWPDRIVINAKPTTSVIREDADDGVFDFSSNVYRIENVEPLVDGSIYEGPYQVVILR